jgi:hypothetical protein
VPDFDNGPFLNVSARAKALIEQFEPGVHQFLPVEFVDIDGKHLEDRWFFVVCNRLDTIDRQHVQGFLLRRGKMWTPIEDYLRDMPDEYRLATTRRKSPSWFSAAPKSAQPISGVTSTSDVPAPSYPTPWLRH